MAQYFTDFSGYTVNTTPSDWTQWINPYTTVEVRDGDYAGATVVGEKFLYVDPGNQNRRALTWDLVPSFTDGEIFIEFSVVNTAGRDVRAAVRFDPTKNIDDASATLDMLGWRGDSSTLMLTSYTDGNPTTDSIASPAVNNFERWAMLITVSGTTETVKLWNVSSGTEPASPQYTTTSTTNTGSGLVGFGSFLNQFYYIHKFGVGTGADSAPRDSASAPSIPGISAKSLYVDNVLLGDISNIECRVISGTTLDGNELYYTSTLSTASGIMNSSINLSSTAASVGDPIVVQLITPDNNGVVYRSSVEDIS